MKIKKLQKFICAGLVATMALALNPVNTAASVDITVGGADILAPASVFSRFAGYTNTSDELTTENLLEDAPVEEVEGTIIDGVFIDSVNVSGMTFRQAMNAVENYVASISEKTITIDAVNEQSDEFPVSDLGIKWVNKEVIREAVLLGKSGNLIAQYKTIADLQHNKRVYPLELKYDNDLITEIVQNEATKYDIAPTNAQIERVDGVFKIKSEGVDGVRVNVAKSVTDITNALSNWDKGDLRVALATEISKVEVDSEAFSQMTDILGTYTTSFKTSSSDRSGNVRTGCGHINGTLLYPGEQMSVYKAVSPFSVENGYFMAGSYMNGMVVESLGGGICQVSSTLYNAVLRAELQVDERHPHSMIVTYVDISSDAAIAESAGKDFKFTNNTDYPIYIEGYTTDEKKITFNIYGHETRPSNRTVSFEGVETSKTEPEGEKIIADSGQPVGFISTQSAHIGYTGELWKVVKVDGVETERVQINKSKYNPSQRTATVGIAAGDASVTAAMQAAIATGSIDYCKQTIAGLTAAANAALAGGQ